jgi:hypothetical protein
VDVCGDGPRRRRQGADDPSETPVPCRRAGRGSPAVPSPARGTDGGACPCSVELSTLTSEPMPDDMRGALVVRAGSADCPVKVVWVPHDAPETVPEGRIMLSWTRTAASSMDVTARLGLAGAQVQLGFWPSLRGEWSVIVRPTLAEVTELHQALNLAKSMLGHLLSGPDGPAAASAAQTGVPSLLGARRRRTARRPGGRGPRQGR